MRSRALIKLLASETGVPDYSDPKHVVWRNAKGEPHRDYGPTATLTDGSKVWYRNGQLHREGGPALVMADGTQYWYRNDKLHRDDGPAITWADGRQAWWVNGKRIR